MTQNRPITIDFDRHEKRGIILGNCYFHTPKLLFPHPQNFCYFHAPNVCYFHTASNLRLSFNLLSFRLPSPTFQVPITCAMSLLPPPTDARFRSRSDLLEHVRTHAFAQGYVVSIIRSIGDVKVWIACDRGGVYRNRLQLSEDTRKRETSSRLIGCPFQLYGRRHADGLWTLTVKNEGD